MSRTPTRSVAKESSGASLRERDFSGVAILDQAMTEGSAGFVSDADVAPYMMW